MYDAANDAKEETVLAICPYRCVSTADMEAKAEYLSRDVPFEMQDKHWQALLDSMRDFPSVA